MPYFLLFKDTKFNIEFSKWRMVILSVCSHHYQNNNGSSIADAIIILGDMNVSFPVVLSSVRDDIVH